VIEFRWAEGISSAVAGDDSVRIEYMARVHRIATMRDMELFKSRFEYCRVWRSWPAPPLDDGGCRFPRRVRAWDCPGALTPSGQRRNRSSSMSDHVSSCGSTTQHDLYDVFLRAKIANSLGSGIRAFQCSCPVGESRCRALLAFVKLYGWALARNILPKGSLGTRDNLFAASRAGRW
jgi:hypothetical protein